MSGGYFRHFRGQMYKGRCRGVQIGRADPAVWGGLWGPDRGILVILSDTAGLDEGDGADRQIWHN